MRTYVLVKRYRAGNSSSEDEGWSDYPDEEFTNIEWLDEAATTNEMIRRLKDSIDRHGEATTRLSVATNRGTIVITFLTVVILVLVVVQIVIALVRY